MVYVKRKKVHGNCLVCGADFVGTVAKRVCSTACYEKARSKGVVLDRECLRCGAKFSTRNPQKQYCSAACQRKAEFRKKYIPHSYSANKKCAVCNSAFVATHPNQRYCCLECRKSGERKRKKTEKVECLCEFCGEKFEPKTKKNRFCSRSCQSRAHTQTKERREWLRQYKQSDAYRESKRREDQRRKALKRELPATLKKAEWRKTLEYFGGVCVYCGRPYAHQDHFIPVSKGGGFTANNIVPACPECNVSKSDVMPLDWLKTQPNGIAKYEKISSYLWSVTWS